MLSSGRMYTRIFTTVALSFAVSLFLSSSAYAHGAPVVTSGTIRAVNDTSLLVGNVRCFVDSNTVYKKQGGQQVIASSKFNIGDRARISCYHAIALEVTLTTDRYVNDGGQLKNGQIRRLKDRLLRAKFTSSNNLLGLQSATTQYQTKRVGNRRDDFFKIGVHLRSDNSFPLGTSPKVILSRSEVEYARCVLRPKKDRASTLNFYGLLISRTGSKTLVNNLAYCDVSPQLQGWQRGFPIIEKGDQIRIQSTNGTLILSTTF